jgi:hypothetical protein
LGNNCPRDILCLENKFCYTGDDKRRIEPKSESKEDMTVTKNLKLLICVFVIVFIASAVIILRLHAKPNGTLNKYSSTVLGLEISYPNDANWSLDTRSEKTDRSIQLGRDGERSGDMVSTDSLIWITTAKDNSKSVDDLARESLAENFGNYNQSTITIANNLAASSYEPKTNDSNNHLEIIYVRSRGKTFELTISSFGHWQRDKSDIDQIIQSFTPVK